MGIAWNAWRGPERGTSTDALAGDTTMRRSQRNPMTGTR
jgi:hypothetical protein